jgi:hypothetical protein
VCEDCPDEVMMGKIKDIILENELRPVGALDGEPLFRTKEEAELYAEMFKGCSGSHPHNVDGVKLFMPCETMHQQLCVKNILIQKEKKENENTRC